MEISHVMLIGKHLSKSEDEKKEENVHVEMDSRGGGSSGIN